MERIVIFDAYGTLFRIDTDDPVLDDVLGASKSEFLALWRSKLLEYSWLTSLAGKWEDFDTLVTKALNYCCKVLHKEEAIINPILMKIYHHPKLYKDAIDLLRKDGFTACIMSNGDLHTLKRAVEENDIAERIDKLFSASEVKSFKVSPLVYRMATSYYNIGPTNIMFVSSNTWDIAGAALFGYETVWVNRENQIFDCLIDEPSHEIGKLTEILNLL